MSDLQRDPGVPARFEWTDAFRDRGSRDRLSFCAVMALASYMDADAIAFPSLRTWARAARMSTNTLAKIRGKLVAAGWLEMRSKSAARNSHLVYRGTVPAVESVSAMSETPVSAMSETAPTECLTSGARVSQIRPPSVSNGAASVAPPLRQNLEPITSERERLGVQAPDAAPRGREPRGFNDSRLELDIARRLGGATP